MRGRYKGALGKKGRNVVTDGWLLVAGWPWMGGDHTSLLSGVWFDPTSDRSECRRGIGA